MWQDKLKEIIYILENSDVNEIEATFWGRKFRVVKDSPNIIGGSDKITTLSSHQPLDSDNKEDQVPVKKNEKSILSPMPGVFYSSQSPDKPPYVEVGDNVKVGQVLCIIESMKIMNEIECEHNGIIKENIWEGLKKRLPDPAPRKLPDRSILISATEKAGTITPNRKEKDYAFLITRYTGCRNGEFISL